jgi:hypothetical protein
VTVRALVVALLLSFAASTAFAQQEQPALLTEQAGELFRIGEFADAAILFQEAYNLDPHPVILFNLARSHQEMGDLPNAHRLFLDLLGSSPTAQVVASAQQRVDEIEASLAMQGYDPATIQQAEFTPRGDLRVESDPSGAALFIADQFVGITPHTARRLATGDVRVRLELEGFHPITATAAVTMASEAVREYALAPRAGIEDFVPAVPGFLSVLAPADGLAVEVDGDLRGLTPLEGVRLAPGDYDIAVRGEGWQTYRLRVTVGTAAEHTIFAPMQRVQGFDDEQTAGLRRGGWALIGAGGASIATGAVLGVMASGSAGDYRNDRSNPERGDIRSRARRQALVADLTIGTGVALVAGGVVMQVVAKKRRDRWSSSDLVLAPTMDNRGRSGVAFRWGF